jgi:protocatechuate 3,4-dioxygenase beta subunit
LPIAGATIVRWHANDLGFYEELYRAKMIAKSDGTFAMSTIAPGQYANLARHIHWYVVADGYRPVIAQTQWADDETIAGKKTWDFSLVKV